MMFFAVWFYHDILVASWLVMKASTVYWIFDGMAGWMSRVWPLAWAACRRDKSVAREVWGIPETGLFYFTYIYIIEQQIYMVLGTYSDIFVVPIEAATTM